MKHLIEIISVFAFCFIIAFVQTACKKETELLEPKPEFKIERVMESPTTVVDYELSFLDDGVTEYRITAMSATATDNSESCLEYVEKFIAVFYIQFSNPNFIVQIDTTENKLFQFNLELFGMLAAERNDYHFTDFHRTTMDEFEPITYPQPDKKYFTFHLDIPFENYDDFRVVLDESLIPFYSGYIFFHQNP